MTYATAALHPRFVVPVLLGLVGCTGPVVEDRAPDTAESAPQEAPGPLVGRVYERSLAFLSEDSLSLVWQISARSQPGGVARRVRGWIARGGAWDPFHDASWEGPPSRVPWRIVPHEMLRLVVGERDALESLVYRNGPRRLELVIGDPVVEWRGPEGGTYQVSLATTTMLDSEVGGMVLDMSRSWNADAPAPGDWAFLVSADTLQVLLVAPEPGPDGRPYRAWAWTAGEELQWPEVAVEWTEVRAFEPARRDVPNSWRLMSLDGELSGELEATSFELQAADGDELFLPVDALFEVSGSLRLEGREVTVQGLLRHVQP